MREEYTVTYRPPGPSAMEQRVLDEVRRSRRILLIGAPGVGKSTLSLELGERLAADSQPPACLTCDPGSPAFGIPGAIGLGHWQTDAWQLRDFEPLCSLDAARFRLPLLQAANRLLERSPVERLLIDAPGTVRGVAGAELLTGLAEVLHADLVLVLERHGRPVELDAELAALAVPVCRLPAFREASSASRRTRARRRTALWDSYLEQADECSLELDGLVHLGTPPPPGAAGAWRGRQIAAFRAARCVAFGEALALEGTVLRARLCGNSRDAEALLVRDAYRARDGSLATAPRFAPAAAMVGPSADAAAQAPAVEVAAPISAGGPSAAGSEAEPIVIGRAPPPAAQSGPYVATLLNGVFGDPLLLVRLRHTRRSLLFDLGEAVRLPARVAHQVTDVFITHAHADHIAGFLSFLRARIGDFPVCRIFGPPGLANNIAGLVAGFHWDRVGDRGPRFEIAELHPGSRLRRFTVSTQRVGPTRAGEAAVPHGLLLSDPQLAVHAVLLDHRTPVLAYALQPPLEIKVRKERLGALGLSQGAWLTELRLAVLAGRYAETLQASDGKPRTVRALADDLLMIRPGRKLVYATDLADTEDNRARLVALARDAHVFFCEATFCEADAEQAARTGHLTAGACARIAVAAGVERLVPFHFSKRYEKDPARVYGEVGEAILAAREGARAHGCERPGPRL